MHEHGLDADAIRTHVTIHWLTGTAGSAIRIYADHAREEPATGRTTVPLGVAQFPGDLAWPPVGMASSWPCHSQEHRYTGRPPDGRARSGITTGTQQDSRPPRERKRMSKLALVTGASSGIGQAFAERLAADGYDLVAVGRRRDRLEELAAAATGVEVQVLVADLATGEGLDAVAEVCATRPLTMLVNNAGVSHYMPLAELPAAKARELVTVKVLAPTLLTRAALPGMLERGEGTIVTVSGMFAFSGPAPYSVMPRRAVYAGSLANAVTMSQALATELEPTPIRVQVVCPGVVATEFHSRQGLDLSAVPRMTAADVVTASLRGLELGEVVCAPGVEDTGLLDAVFQADLAALAGQSPELAKRYR